MFYNARWYDPALGRFAQADSIVPGGVQGLDRYAYVNNNPMRYTDPSGHICSDPDDPTPSCEGSTKQTTKVGNKMVRGESGQKNTKPNNNDGCTTVTCRAFQGDWDSIFDLLIPTHIGFREQLEIGVNPNPALGFGPSGTLGINFAYNRVSGEFAAFADWTGEASVSTGTPISASLTEGPIVGWGSSTIRDVAQGESLILSATAAYEGALSTSISVPLDGDPFDVHIDPIYGQVPTTIYGGGGIGYAYGSLGVGATSVFAYAIYDFSP